MITGGTHKIVAADNGITAKDQIKILNGSLTLMPQMVRSKRRIRMTQSLKYLYCRWRFWQLRQKQDGFHATGSIVVDDGTITVNSVMTVSMLELDTVIRGG